MRVSNMMLNIHKANVITNTFITSTIPSTSNPSIDLSSIYTANLSGSQRINKQLLTPVFTSMDSLEKPFNLPCISLDYRKKSIHAQGKHDNSAPKGSTRFESRPFLVPPHCPTTNKKRDRRKTETGLFRMWY